MRGSRAIAGTLLAIAASAAMPLTRARAQQPALHPWSVPDADALPAGASKDAVLYGRRLFTETPALIGPEVADVAMRYAGNNLTCQSCHLIGGTQPFALPITPLTSQFIP